MNIEDAIAKSACGIAVKEDTYKTPAGYAVKAQYIVDRNRNGTVREVGGHNSYKFEDYMRGGATWLPWEEWINGKRTL
jgi:hypothetical protein